MNNATIGVPSRGSFSNAKKYSIVKEGDSVEGEKYNPERK